MQGWSRLKKGVVISAVVFFGLVGLGAAIGPDKPKTIPPPSPPPTGVKADKVEVKIEATNEPIAFNTQNINDASLTDGVTQTRVEGANGVKTKTSKVTYTNGIETDRKLVKEEVTTAPVTKVIAHGTKVNIPSPPPASSNCDPNYTGCVPNVYPSDVDCAGGTGNGPYYTGPTRIIGYDRYGLDRDGDGYACE